MIVDRMKVQWRNFQVRGIGKAHRVLVMAMQDDPEFAHAWMCNIAMPIFDGAKGKLTIEECNHLAEDLMRHLFNVKPHRRNMDGILESIG